mgnify:CR=1 FL=1
MRRLNFDPRTKLFLVLLCVLKPMHLIYFFSSFWCVLLDCWQRYAENGDRQYMVF